MWRVATITAIFLAGLFVHYAWPHWLDAVREFHLHIRTGMINYAGFGERWSAANISR